MKPQILVARAIFPEVLAQLREVFDVDYNEADEIFSLPNSAADCKARWGR